MPQNIKERLLNTVNKVVQLNDYEPQDCIFSQKYNIPPVAMVYILQKLAEDFNFAIIDDFVDALEMCSFAQLEALLEQYSNSANVA